MPAKKVAHRWPVGHKVGALSIIEQYRGYSGTGNYFKKRYRLECRECKQVRDLDESTLTRMIQTGKSIWHESCKAQ